MAVVLKVATTAQTRWRSSCFNCSCAFFRCSSGVSGGALLGAGEVCEPDWPVAAGASVCADVCGRSASGASGKFSAAFATSALTVGSAKSRSNPRNAVENHRCIAISAAPILRRAFAQPKYLSLERCKGWLPGFRNKGQHMKGLNMVEAAGVEPASEIVVSTETPCSVEFRRFRVARLESTRCVQC